jgi:hypothetical protein
VVPVETDPVVLAAHQEMVVLVAYLLQLLAQVVLVVLVVA